MANNRHGNHHAHFLLITGNLDMALKLGCLNWSQNSVAVFARAGVDQIKFGLRPLHGSTTYERQ